MTKLPAFDQQREVAHLGGEAKEAKLQERRDAIVAKLPRLVDEASAKLSCEIIRDGAVAGDLPGSQAGAATRSVEVWLKLRAHELDRARFAELEAKLSALEAELARERKGRK